MLNKKSQVEDWIPTLISLLILVSIALFFPIFKASANERINEQIKFQSLSIDADQILVNYLGTPIKLENFPDADITDAIAYYFATLDENILKQIESKTDEFYSKSKLETDFSSWSLDIKNPEKKKTVTIESEKAKKRKRELSDNRLYDVTRREVSKITLPYPIKDESIEIQLFNVIGAYS